MNPNEFRFNAGDIKTNETNSSIITTNCCNTIKCRERLTCINGNKIYVVNYLLILFLIWWNNIKFAIEYILIDNLNFTKSRVLNTLDTN